MRAERIHERKGLIMAKKKDTFTAQGFDYGMNQATNDTPVKEEPPKTFYRFNAKFPIEYKAFLQEMAWRNRLPINDYLVKIIGEYMDAHPEWKETIDILNK